MFLENLYLFQMFPLPIYSGWCWKFMATFSLKQGIWMLQQAICGHQWIIILEELKVREAFNERAWLFDVTEILCLYFNFFTKPVVGHSLAPQHCYHPEGPQEEAGCYFHSLVGQDHFHLKNKMGSAIFQ